MVTTARLAALIGAAALLVALSAVTASAYVGQNPYVVHLAGPSGSVRCDSTVTITATIRTAATGGLAAGQQVIWDVPASPSGADWVSPRTVLSDAHGQAATTLTFGPAEGQRTVQARIADWPATIKVTCQGGVSLSTSKPTASARPITSPTAPTPATPLPTPDVPATDPPASLGAPDSSTRPPQSPAVIATLQPGTSAQPTAAPAEAPPDSSTSSDLLPIALIVLVLGATIAGAAAMLLRRR